MEKGILLVIGELGQGGQERQLSYLANELHKSNTAFSVVVLNYNPEERYAIQFREQGIPLISFLRSDSFTTKLKNLRKLASEADILQSYSFYTNIYVAIACLFKKAKAIGCIRSRLNLYRLDYGRIPFYLNVLFPLRKVSNNRSFAMEAPGGLPLSLITRNVKVIPNAMDLSVFGKADTSSLSGLIKTVSVGRMSHEKGIDQLIELHVLLLRAGYNVEHVHAGSGVLMEEMKRLVRENGIENSFLLPGNTNDINRHLCDGQIFLHMANSEGFPNAVMEAMAVGLPVICTKVGDVPYILDDGQGGYIVDQGDVEGAFRASVKLINSSDLRKQMAAHNIRMAHEKFDLPVFMKAYKSYWESIK